MKLTRFERDPAADDIFVEAALVEICGDRQPPDPRRVLAATPAQRAAAAVRLASARRQLHRGAHRRLLLVAALLAGVALTALAWPWPEHAATGVDRRDVQVAASDAFQPFVDRFHRVMPWRPTALRDAAVRRQVAPLAIPVLRQIDDYLLGDADAERRARLLPEFRIYALTLGDEQAQQRVQQQGAAAARMLTAAAAAICAADAPARQTALQQLRQLLAAGSDLAMPVVRVLLIAGDLEADEATRLAEAAVDPAVAARLTQAAQWASKDPRRLLGAPFAISGKQLGGGELSSQQLRGKVVLVHFWASTERACDYALPDILRLRIRHPDTDLAIVGVSCDSEPQQLCDYLLQHPEVCWPQLYDAQHPGWHQLAASLGVHTLPRVFLIDRHGVLRSVDAQDNLAAEVQRLVRR